MFSDVVQDRPFTDHDISRDLMVLLSGGVRRGRPQADEVAGYKLALDEVADIVCTDLDGAIVYANAQFCRINRCTVSEIIGRDNSMFASGVHPRSLYRDLWDTIEAGHVWRGELCNRALDGTLYWTDTTIAPRFCEQGSIVGYIAMRTDITARKLA